MIRTMHMLLMRYLKSRPHNDMSGSESWPSQKPQAACRTFTRMGRLQTDCRNGIKSHVNASSMSDVKSAASFDRSC